MTNANKVQWRIAHKMRRLAQEHAAMREALEFYATPGIGDGGKRAAEALQLLKRPSALGASRR